MIPEKTATGRGPALSCQRPAKIIAIVKMTMLIWKANVVCAGSNPSFQSGFAKTDQA